MKHLLLGLIISLASIISLSSNAKSSSRVFLPTCNNYGDGVSYSYVSCLNRNFSTISRKLDHLYLSSCQNFGSKVSYSFTSCVERNITTVARELGTFAPYCSNYGDKLSYSYQSCVNRAFSQFQNSINRL